MKNENAEYKKKVADLKKFYRKRNLSRNSEFGRSGWNGTAEEWKKTKGVILGALDQDGRFLDVGCANGILCRDLRKWALEIKGIDLIPYGFDFLPDVIKESRKKNPGFEKNFVVAEIRDYLPKVTFRYIHLSFKCCRNDSEVIFVLKKYLGFLEQGGILMACSYYDGWGGGKSADYAKVLNVVAVSGDNLGYSVIRFLGIPGQEVMLWLKKL